MGRLASGCNQRCRGVSPACTHHLELQMLEVALEPARGAAVGAQCDTNAGIGERL